MSLKFITGILTVSATIATLSAAPAKAADADDVARFLGAAATLYIIGKALDGDARAHVSIGTGGYNTPRIVNRHATPKAHAGERALPRVCLREVKGADTKFVMSRKCLKKNYHNASSLPKACRIDVRNKNKVFNVFSVRCLRGRGYEVARR